MTATQPVPAELLAGGLSCFTANLAGYLAGRVADPASRIARTTRLATREEGDLLAFSHHAESLGTLDDGRVLRYASASSVAELLLRLEAELFTEGAVLVVTYAGGMPWSPAGPKDRAPHFVLVTGRRRDAWRVVDGFAAQLPAGHQEPFAGWLSARELTLAMSVPGSLDPVHRLRKRNAFGAEVPVPPDAEYQWLHPASTVAEPPRSGWRTGDVLGRLAGFFAELGEHPARAEQVDDLWAAAQHHTYRYRQLCESQPLRPAERELVTAAHQAWTELPMALRFAADSAARGRPRPAMVRTTFDHLAAAERRCAEPLAAHGYATTEGM